MQTNLSSRLANVNPLEFLFYHGMWDPVTHHECSYSPHLCARVSVPHRVDLCPLCLGPFNPCPRLGLGLSPAAVSPVFPLLTQSLSLILWGPGLHSYLLWLSFEDGAKPPTSLNDLSRSCIDKTHPRSLDQGEMLADYLQLTDEQSEAMHVSCGDRGHNPLSLSPVPTPLATLLS